MIMKRLTGAIIGVLVTGCACAQISTNPIPWMATVNVVDASTQPVAGATVEVWYYVKPPPGQTEASEKIEGLTDSRGLFTASHEDRSVDISFRAAKAGYYPSTYGHTLFLPGQFDQQTVAANRHPQVTLLLKKVGKPIPMCAKRIRSQPPVNEKAVGYDLESGDWVTPYGKGKNADIMFTAHHDHRATDDWDYQLIVSFPRPGDGIQPFTISDLEKTSALRSPHEAPENGYQPQWVKSQSRRPGEPSVYGIDKNLNFFFRVRTVLDEKGNVKTANYGKIYGDFMDFQYFLNPEANSRNVEFDPAKNRCQNIHPADHVREP